MKLFRTPGIFAYLIAIFLNAFTDLGHKILVQNTLFKVYDGAEQIMYTALVNAFMLVPFIALFSPTSFLATRFKKANIMRVGAVIAVVLTSLLTYCYYQGYFMAAFYLTLLMATQSAIYSPAKYGYIKELVDENLVSAGNAALQSVTTVAILAGIIVYTILFENSVTASAQNAQEIVKGFAPLGFLLILGSVIECLLLLKVPLHAEDDATKQFSWQHYLTAQYLKSNLKTITKHPTIFRSILYLSVFWSVSQVLLAVFGAYAKETFGITNTIIVQGVMALAAIGIILGSVLASRYSKFFVHLGLVPMGALGMFFMIVLLPFITSMTQAALLFLLFGLFAGFVIVPLNAYIQLHSAKEEFGTVLAGNNFVQNIWMLTALVITTITGYLGVNAIWIFYALMIVLFFFVVSAIKNYFTMFVSLIIERIFLILYNIKYEGLENLPKQRAVLLLGNHISWIDWAIVQIPYERRIRYMMERSIYDLPVLRWWLQKLAIIPISTSGAKESFKRAKEVLNKKEVVGIFPEGEISYDGELSTFKRGFEVIAKHHEGVIVPFYISGLYGSRFSRAKGSGTRSRWFSRRVIVIEFSTAIAMHSSAQEVFDVIKALREKRESE